MYESRQRCSEGYQVALTALHVASELQYAGLKFVEKQTQMYTTAVFFRSGVQMGHEKQTLKFDLENREVAKSVYDTYPSYIESTFIQLVVSSCTLSTYLYAGWRELKR